MRLRSFICFLLIALPASSELIVKITGVKNDRGKIGLLIFKNKDGFPDKTAKAFKQTKKEPKKGEIVFKLPDLPPGNYAFAAIHDENNNDKLDKNFIGLPKEGVAISNYQKLALPKFEKAVIKKPSSPVTLKMLYP